jgi:GNAT superfamily N-acetyltransferase
MRTIRIDDPIAFADRITALLLPHEARNDLILGVAGVLADDPTSYPEHHAWLVEDDEGATVTAALLTPPRSLVLADPRRESSPGVDDAEAIAALVAAILTDGTDVPGVFGNRPGVDTFAGAWTAATGSAAEVTMHLGLFALDEVRARAGSETAGSWRPAGASDRELVSTWWLAFSDEALPASRQAAADSAREADAALRAPAGGVGLWELDGVAVAMCSWGRPTRNGIRISHVYTPPELRRRGAASALVAAVSRWLLEQGRRYCSLSTDLANPTSNAIYRRIGYRQIAESAEFRFRHPEGRSR